MQAKRVINGRTWTATTNGHSAATSMPKFVQRSWWRDILPHREDLVMPDGRQIKGGIVLHPIIATALVSAVVVIGGAMYRNFSSELSWQHDQLVILATQKADDEKRAAEKTEELSKRLQNIEATEIALGRDMATIKAQKGQTRQ